MLCYKQRVEGIDYVIFEGESGDQGICSFVVIQFVGEPHFRSNYTHH